MRYQKSLEIEQRLAQALELIAQGQHSTPKLAEKLGVSIPTVSRYVTALRERGHTIRAERNDWGWHYILVSDMPSDSPSTADTSERVLSRTQTHLSDYHHPAGM